MRTSYFVLYILLVHLVTISSVFGQNNIDTVAVPDSTLVSSTQVDTVQLQFDDDDLNSIINYSAKDSIVYDITNQRVYLFGNADMDYDQIDIESELITLDWNTYTLTSEGVTDSNGLETGTPVFSDNGQIYEARKMEYNFKTKKGKTYNVVTEQDDAYIHSEIVMKNEYDEWFGHKTWYTTCENKDHPHFYIEAKKSKVIPGKLMVTGPANLVVSGVNTPLVLPFALIPTKQGRRSGFIFPEFGEAPSLGFFLRGMGYHWAVNDHVGVNLTTDIYTGGQFAVSGGADYVKKYKYSGSFLLTYNRRPPTDRVVSPIDGKNNDISINWRHTKDPKSKPNNSFSATLTGRSSSFNDNSLITTNQLLEVEVNSNINYRRRFEGKNYSIALSARHNQNFNTGVLNITAPELIFDLTRINPFERKINSGSKKFYENIGFRFSTRGKAQINTIDSLLFTPQVLDDMNFGFQHQFTVDAPFNLLKHFKVTPAFTFTDRWYFKRETLSWQERYLVEEVYNDTSDVLESQNFDNNFLNSEVESGFYDVRQYQFSTSLSTSLTGFYNFKTKRVEAIRHVMKPTLTYSFSPDFSKERFGYYDSYTDFSKGGEGVEQTYNRFGFLTGLYGSPGTGVSNLLTLRVTNAFDMKIRSKNSADNTSRKVPILENLTFQTSYDITADSLKVRPITVNAASSLFKGILTWNVNTIFSPYAVNGVNRTINTSMWSANGRLLRLTSMRFSFGVNLGPKNKEAKPPVTAGTIEERDYVLSNPQLFYDFDIPWSLRVQYSVGLTNGHFTNPDSLVVSGNALTMSGHLNITPKWQINFSTGYNIRDKDLTLTRITATRSLHCWEMAFDWTAYPLNRQTYAIRINVVSPVLQALKLSRKQPPSQGAFF